MPKDTKKKRRTRKRGGGSEGTHTSTTKSLPYTQYAMPDGASSHREAALSRTSTMNNNQQNMINTHGGRRATKNARKKRKTVRRKSILKKLKAIRRKSKSRRSYKKSKDVRRKIKKHTRRVRSKSTKRRGKMGGGSDSGQPVTVPSFANSGSSVSGINANSMSQSSNSTSLNANSQASNDCYATGTCKQSGGFRNHYEVFGGRFGKSMTGGARSRKRRAGSKTSGCGCTSGGKGVRDYNDKNTNPNRQDAHGSGGLIERMFGN